MSTRGHTDVTSVGDAPDNTHGPGGSEVPLPPGWQGLAVLGRGAHSVVHHARREPATTAQLPATANNEAATGDFAIKVMTFTGQADHRADIAFRREAAILAGIADAGLPRIHEVGSVGGHPYMIMDLVVGRPLADLVHRSTLPPEQTIHLGLDLAGQLTAIHRKGLVHRDLKPQNVIVESSGRARLIDFGLATWQTTDVTEGSTVGTLAYAAPEQTGMLHRPVDKRSDLYALGVLLYECLAGRLPFEAPTTSELLRMHAVTPPPDLRSLAPQAGPTLTAMVEALLAKDPDDRYQDGQDLVDDLLRLAADPTARFEPRTTTAEHPDGQSPFRGRHAELARLVQSWTDAAAGRGGVVVVVGAAGAGKTRLCGETAAFATGQEALVLRGKCPQDGTVPFAPLREAVETYLRRVNRLPAPRQDLLVHALRSAAGPSAARLAPLTPALASVLGVTGTADTGGSDGLVAATAEFLGELARGHAGLLLQIDDVQWADQATVRVLAQLADQLADAGLPLMLLMTARDDERSAAAAESVVHRVRAAVRLHLHLHPLDETAATQLIAAQLPGLGSLSDLARLLAARGDGNPLVILEYLRAVVDGGLLTPSWGGWSLDEAGLERLELPQDAMGLVLARMAGLGPHTRELLTLAALLGTRFRVDQLAALAGRELEAILPVLVEATGRQLVERRDPGRYAFVHDRIREALLDLDADTLAEAHQQAAEVLDALLEKNGGADAEDVYALAHHFVQGRSQRTPERAFAACVAAARLALSDVVPDTAVVLLRHAAGLRPDPNADFLELYGTALREAGEFTEALVVLDRALERHVEPMRRASTLMQIAECHRATWHAAECRAAAHRGLAELGLPWPTNPVKLICSTLVRLVASLLMAWTRIGFGTVRGARRERYTLACALWLTAGYAAVLDMRPAEQVAIALRAPYWVNRLGPGPQYVRNHTGGGIIAELIGFRRLARSIYRKADAVCAALHDPVLQANIQYQRGAAAYISGNDDGELWTCSLTEHGRYVDTGAFSDAAGAMCLDEFLRGRVPETRAWLQVIERRLRRDGANETISSTTLTAMGHTLAGNHAAAAAELARTEALIPAHSGRGLRVNQLQSTLITLAEQQDFGARFDECVAEFLAMGLGPREMIRSYLPMFHLIAVGRISQCRYAADRGAPGPDRAQRLAAARTAVRQLRRAARGTVLRGYATVFTADLAVLEGRYGRALRLLDRLAPFRVPAPSITFEAARVRVRALQGLGYEAEALRTAQYARWLSTVEGWPHRARWVNAEFAALAASSARTSGALASSSELTGLGQERLQALQKVGMAASRILDPDELARITLDEMIRILRAERAFLFLTDPDDREATSGHQLGRDAAGKDLSTLTAYSASIVERVRASREPVVLTGADDGAVLGAESVLAHGLRSILAAPLLLDDRLLGVVYLDSRIARGIFTAEDAALLTALTNPIATALETARAAQLEVTAQAARRERDLSEALRASLQEMSQTLEPEQVLVRLLHSVARIVGCEQAWLLRETPDGTTVLAHRPGAVTAATAGVPVRDPEVRQHDAEVRQHDPHLWPLVADGPVVGAGIPEMTSSTLMRLLGPLPDETTSWLALPLESGKLRLGVLLLVSSAPDAYPNGLVDVASTVVAQGVTAYDRAALFARVQELAVVDELTGIPNRRSFFEQAERSAADALRDARPLAAAMVDIDHFKQINDTYGHLTGDDVIHAVASRLAATVRAEDVLGRYGGEEFAVVLPGASPGHEAPERLRRTICEHPVITRSGPLKVSVSVGVSFLRLDGDTLTELLSRADRALYLAKERGRDRVESS